MIDMKLLIERLDDHDTKIYIFIPKINIKHIETSTKFDGKWLFSKNKYNNIYLFGTNLNSEQPHFKEQT